MKGKGQQTRKATVGFPEEENFQWEIKNKRELTVWEVRERTFLAKGAPQSPRVWKNVASLRNGEKANISKGEKPGDDTKEECRGRSCSVSAATKYSEAPQEESDAIYIFKMIIQKVRHVENGLSEGKNRVSFYINSPFTKMTTSDL